MVCNLWTHICYKVELLFVVTLVFASQPLLTFPKMHQDHYPTSWSQHDEELFPHLLQTAELFVQSLPSQC